MIARGKVFITGARGQLGGELCRQLGSLAEPSHRPELDLTDAAALGRTVRAVRPAVVVHCAAYTQVDRAESEPEQCRAVNATAVEALAAVCRELDCPLLQVSTDYVFAGNRSLLRPLTERDPASPQGVYATSKFAGEQAAQGCRHWIVRTCGLYTRPAPGDTGPPRNFVSAILRKAASGQALRVVADQHCTPSYVPHVARAIGFLIGVEGPPAPPGLYHVVNQGATTWYEFAVEILRLSGLAVPIEPIATGQYPAAAPRPSYSVLDTSAYHALGGPAMPDWRAALAECLR